MTRSRARCLALLALLLLLPAAAFARPGGGHGFSGGGSSGGGGGGGGDGGALLYLVFRLLFWLVFHHPFIGIPLVVALVFAFLKWGKRDRTEWTVGTVSAVAAPPMRAQGIPPSESRRRLQDLRKLDPSFSVVVFEDFLYALYASVQEARGSGKLAGLAPWVAEGVRAQMEARLGGVQSVTAIIVGALRYVDVSTAGAADEDVRVVVEFEANYTQSLKAPDGTTRDQGLYVVEQWTLRRKAGARSRPPEKARVFSCPSCGAPLTGLRGNTCEYCGQAMDTGQFDWVVDEARVVRREARAPQLTGTVEEQGTSLPTVIDPDLQAGVQELSRRDPAFTLPNLEERLRLVFEVFQKAWSAQDLMPMRPYLSDNLWQTQLYWVYAYRAQGLRNVTDATRILRVEPARVTSDTYFDAVTVRVTAEGLDWTEDAQGKVVGGNRTRPRLYTEYWTLIRGAGAHGPARTDAFCPSCGAALKVNQAGSCEYCSARVSAGTFDWVLSRIEQDEVYAG